MAVRTFSRGFVLWRFSYAGPKCSASFVMRRRPKIITKAVIPTGCRKGQRTEYRDAVLVLKALIWDGA
jgi:hypothetical protein